MNSNLPSLKVIRRSFSGFTLIELLVVITIIAILTAILFPVFANVREKARQTGCLSNTKQIGLSIMQYAQDFDETLMPQNYGSNAPSQAKWMDMIYPYVNSEQAFTCPSTDSKNVYSQYRWVGRTTNGRLTNGDKYYGSYDINVAYYSGKCGAVKVTCPFPFIGTGNPAATPLAKLPVPAETIMISEGDYGAGSASISWNNCTVNPKYRPVGDTYTTSAGANQSYPYPVLTMNNAANVLLRHHNGANVIWCDGHAKWSPGTELYATHTVGGQAVAYAWTVEED